MSAPPAPSKPPIAFRQRAFESNTTTTAAGLPPAVLNPGKERRDNPRDARSTAAVPRPLRVGTLLALALLGAGAGLVLFCFDPRQYHFYPVCFFHKTTGLLCPGCGGLRSLYQLLHGHVVAAFHFNPMLVVSLPFLGWLGAKSAWQTAKNQPASLGIRPIWLWLSLVAVLVVSVLRNLPGAPFALLRP
jgi:Protein of unknown function (DUF2752)